MNGPDAHRPDGAGANTYVNVVTGTDAHSQGGAGSLDADGAGGDQLGSARGVGGDLYMHVKTGTDPTGPRGRWGFVQPYMHMGAGIDAF